MGTPSAEPRLPYRVKRLYLLTNQCIDEALRADGLARSQWQVLWRVRKAETLSQRELQQQMEIESATLTGIVDVLVRKGWLDRLESATDKRVRMLRFTAEGERRWADIPDPIDDVESAMLEGIPADERTRLGETVDVMIRNLQRHREAGTATCAEG